MTPLEANEEARVALANAKWNGEKARIETDVLECLLATAEREAKLRQDIQTFVEGYGAVFIAPDNSDPPRLWLWAGDPHDETAEPLIPFAALESKGGE